MFCKPTEARTREDSTLVDFGKMPEFHQKLKCCTYRQDRPQLALSRFPLVSFDARKSKVSSSIVWAGVFGLGNRRGGGGAGSMHAGGN